MSTFADATMSASEFLREHGNGEAQPVGLTEDELALEFMRRHGDTLRYVAGVGRVDALGWHPMGIVRLHYKPSISRVPSVVMPPRGCPRASTRSAVENLSRSDRATLPEPNNGIGMTSL